MREIEETSAEVDVRVAAPDGSALYRAQYLWMDLCSAMTRARAEEGMHSMSPSSGDVGNTLRVSTGSRSVEGVCCAFYFSGRDTSRMCGVG